MGQGYYSVFVFVYVAWLQICTVAVVVVVVVKLRQSFAVDFTTLGHW